jgi:hypothetical protein
VTSRGPRSLDLGATNSAAQAPSDSLDVLHLGERTWHGLAVAPQALDVEGNRLVHQLPDFVGRVAGAEPRRSPISCVCRGAHGRRRGVRREALIMPRSPSLEPEPFCVSHNDVARPPPNAGSARADRMRQLGATLTPLRVDARVAPRDDRRTAAPIDRFHRAAGEAEVVRRRMRNAVTCENAPLTSAKSAWPIFQAGDAGSIPVTRSRSTVWPRESILVCVRRKFV